MWSWCTDLFLSQGLWWAYNSQGNQYHLCKATTGWKIPAEAQKIIWEHQEGIPKSACSCNCKWNISSFSSFITYYSLQGPWDQERFEQLVMEWVIACDQPFEEVQHPEFFAMMNYMHHSGTSLEIPKHNGIKWHLIKMGNEIIDSVHKMFLVWTYTFLLYTILTME